MRIRTFLLAGAAGLTAVGGARAADLVLAAEPVDYVRVCTAFGDGYYYIPGTDTCLKLAGEARMDAYIYTNDQVDTNADGKADQNWQMESQGRLEFTGNTASDLGTVVTYAKLKGETEFIGPTKLELDYAYGAVGGLLFGYNDSLFDYAGGASGYTYDGPINSDTNTNLVNYTHKIGIWGIALGIEDPYYRYDGASNATGNYPDIVAALSATEKTWNWQLSGALTDRTSGTGWAAQLGFNLGAEDHPQLIGAIAYSENAPSFVGGTNCTGVCANQGAWWSAFLSGKTILSEKWTAAATASYLDGPTGSDSEWEFETGAYWAPNDATEVGFEITYTTSDTDPDALGFHTQWKTMFNGG